MTPKMRFLVVLVWAALPLMAFRYWSVWQALPARLATHFDAAGNANGWMTREQSLIFALGFLGSMLAAFTLSLFLIVRKYGVTAFWWALLGFFYVEISMMGLMLNSILNYSLNGEPISTAPLLIITPIAVVGLIAIALVERRGLALHRSAEAAGSYFEVIAEEVHSGKTWGMVFAVPAIGAIWAAAAVPNSAMRFSAAIFCIVFIGVCAMAWNGFHYCFTRQGLEIRTLGFRMQTIQAASIKEYGIEHWSALRGYGIRGVGNHKAYVWGNSGVRVQLSDGDVFLGHDDPQQIVRDLDAMKQTAK